MGVVVNTKLNGEMNINGFRAKTGSSPFSVSLNLAFIDEETLVVFQKGTV